MASKKPQTASDKTAALAKLDREGLEKELSTARRELYLLQMKKVAGELKETHQLREHRKHVARTLTFLSAL